MARGEAVQFKEVDAKVYKMLCAYINRRVDFPGAAQMAADLEYKSPQTILDSLRRLEAARLIEIKGDRQINAIIVQPSGIRLSSRKKYANLTRRFN